MGVQNDTANKKGFSQHIVVRIGILLAYVAKAEDKNDEALKLIVETARQLCQDVPLEQTVEGVELNAEATAKIGGLVGSLANLGASSAGKFTEEKTKGILRKDLVPAIRDRNTCNLKVLEILKDRLLFVQNPQLQYEQINITPYAIQNKELFCNKLNAILASARRQFRGDLIKSDSKIGSGKVHRIVLPNTRWCAIHYMPAFITRNRRDTPYYTCAIFNNEADKSIAYSKFESYKELFKTCLGQTWTVSEQERSDRQGSEVKYHKDAVDPYASLQIRSSKDGLDMYVDVLTSME